MTNGGLDQLELEKDPRTPRGRLQAAHLEATKSLAADSPRARAWKACQCGPGDRGCECGDQDADGKRGMSRPDRC
jgi:hypothetical protein